MHLAVLIGKHQVYKYYLKVFKYLCQYLVFKYYLNTQFFIEYLAKYLNTKHMVFVTTLSMRTINWSVSVISF